MTLRSPSLLWAKIRKGGGGQKCYAKGALRDKEFEGGELITLVRPK